MDLFADMLYDQLLVNHAAEVNAHYICPPYRRRAGNLPFFGGKRFSINTDRLTNRMWDYPRYLRGQRSEFELFHIVDHSYSQLVHVLPAAQTGVYCHDLDAFRCLLEPTRDPRPRWFRAMARRILNGLQKAALVFYSTGQIREEIERHGLIDPSRLIHAPPGVSPEFCPSPIGAPVLPPTVAALGGAPFLLHVGSCIPRKRIDVLLDVFAGILKQHPELHLVKVGASWSNDQLCQMDLLGLSPSIVPLQGLTRKEIAALYRAAALVLQPSESEGFGLPIIEALACGAIVVATDLPVFREVAGQAAVYCPMGDSAAWVATVARLLANPETAPTRMIRAAQASQFSWHNHARAIVDAYRRLGA